MAITRAQRCINITTPTRVRPIPAPATSRRIGPIAKTAGYRTGAAAIIYGHAMAGYVHRHATYGTITACVMAITARRTVTAMPRT